VTAQDPYVTRSCDELMPESFDAALVAASSSPDWQERINAVRLLASQADDPRAFDELTRRLDDANTAVIEEAAEALVRGGGTAGLQSVLHALATGEDDAGYRITARLANMAHDGYPLVAPIRALLHDTTTDAAVCEGAKEIIGQLYQGDSQ
jgi:HEAT repeat protein